jgi:peptide/nickel transport system permease protein
LAGGPAAWSAPRRKAIGIVFWVAVGWLGLVVFGAVFANLLPLQDPTSINIFGSPNGSISSHHLLGTDQLARDVFSRLVYGTRTSLVIAVSATALGMVVGATLGMLSAYARGRFDAALSFFMYCGLAFPAIIAVIAILDFWGRSELHVILVLSLFSIPLIFRLIRAATLATATKEFITAARSQGATSSRVLFHDIFPSVAPAIIVYTIFTLGGLIAVEGALSFLGLSVQPPTPSWGNMISDAGNDPGATLAFKLVPSLVLFLTLVSLFLIGEGIRRRFDPGEGEARL